MNQDQLKIKLDTYTDHKDFTVIFSGKCSKKVDGLYHHEKHEIIIHNKNFFNDIQLMYTAIHELAHHIDFIENHAKMTRSAHGKDFRVIFHRIVDEAIQKGDYEDFDNEFVQDAITTNKAYTVLLKTFGKKLIALLDKCQKDHRDFEDVVIRKLSMKPSQAKTIMKVYAMDVSEEIGGEFAKEVAKIKNPIERKEAEEIGEIPTKTKAPETPESELAEAEKNLRRVEKQIANLERKRQVYEDMIEGYENS